MKQFVIKKKLEEKKAKEEAEKEREKELEEAEKEREKELEKENDISNLLLGRTYTLVSYTNESLMSQCYYTKDNITFEPSNNSIYDFVLTFKDYRNTGLVDLVPNSYIERKAYYIKHKLSDKYYLSGWCWIKSYTPVVNYQTYNDVLMEGRGFINKYDVDTALMLEESRKRALEMEKKLNEVQKNNE